MLVTGEIDGLGWYEVPRSVFTWTQAFHGDQDAPVVTALCPLPSMPDVHTQQAALRGGGEIAYRYAHTIGFQMIDAATAMPGRLIAYDKYAFQGFDFAGWLAERLETPETVDLRLDVETYRSRAHAVARTMRKGAIVDVRRKLDESMPLVGQMVPIMRYFERNCPRVDGVVDGLSCGGHVARLLERLDGPGRTALSAWTGGRMIEARKLTGATLPATGVDLLTLRKDEHSNMILAAAMLVGGHHIEDDASGTTVTLNAQLSDTIVNSLKGETLGRVVDLDWLSDLTIRTVAKGEEGRIRIRAFGDRVPLHVTEDTAPDAASTRILLEGLVGPGRGQHGDWMEIDRTVAGLLDQLPSGRVGAILADLAVESDVDLTGHGLPGWRLARNGRTIHVKDSPSENLRNWLSTVIGRIDREG